MLKVSLSFPPQLVSSMDTKTSSAVLFPPRMFASSNCDPFLSLLLHLVRCVVQTSMLDLLLEVFSLKNNLLPFGM